MGVIENLGLRFASAVGLAAVLTTICVRYSARLRLVATPRADRWHKQPTPNTGGLAILLSCAIFYAIADRGHYASIAIAAVSVSILGFIDDRIHLRPLVKFLGQSLAAIAVIAAGVVFRPTGWEPLNLAITFLWIAGITNAFNLIDNMDGLCAGVTIIIAGFRCWSAVQNGDLAGAQLLATIAGSFFGFLFFNYKSAKIFMGDAGSMFAGFSLACLAIAAPVPNTRIFLSAILGPAFTFLYPIFDTMLVSLLRRAAGRPISVGGRDHSSHRLASSRLGEQRAVWVLWALTAVGSAAGACTYWMPVGVLAVGTLLVAATVIFGIFLAGLPAYELMGSAPLNSPRLQRLMPILRIGSTLLLDVALAGVALLTAFLLRWEDAFLGEPLAEFRVSLPVVLGCQALACFIFRTFHLGWRWSGARDVLTMAESAVFSSTLSIFVVWMGGLRGYSRGVIVLYALLLFSFMSASRLSLRFLWRTMAAPRTRRRAGILAATSSVELLVLALQHDETRNILPIVILDFNPARGRTRVHGVPVRYAGDDPVRILLQASADLLVIPANHELTPEHRKVIDACADASISVAEFEFALRPYRLGISVDA